MNGYCEQHAPPQRRKYDQQRGSAHARGYDRRWQKIRRMHLRNHPMCVFCLEEGRSTPANEVDHIDGNSRNNDPANLRSACKSCHSRRTYRDQSLGRAPAGGVR